MYRFRKHELRYKKDKKIQVKCPFCDSKSKQIIKKIGNFYLINNIYGYDLWDRRKVLDHIMIVPKKHEIDLKNIPDKDILVYTKIMTKYSDLGYDIFIRATLSETKTQHHFHTHLIKTDGELAKEVKFTADPYNLIFK